MKSSVGLIAIAIFVLGFSSVGCSKYKVAQVSGVITLNNKPLEDATITFTPAESVEGEIPISAGRTDSQGKYSLRLVSDDTSGALVGKHTVRVNRNIKTESDIMTPAEAKKGYLPSHDFSFDVVAGSNEANFSLENKPGKK